LGKGVKSENEWIIFSDNIMSCYAIYANLNMKIICII